MLQRLYFFIFRKITFKYTDDLYAGLHHWTGKIIYSIYFINNGDKITLYLNNYGNRLVKCEEQDWLSWTTYESIDSFQGLTFDFCNEGLKELYGKVPDIIYFKINRKI